MERLLIPGPMPLSLTLLKVPPFQLQVRTSKANATFQKSPEEVQIQTQSHSGAQGCPPSQATKPMSRTDKEPVESLNDGKNTCTEATKAQFQFDYAKIPWNWKGLIEDEEDTDRTVSEEIQRQLDHQEFDAFQDWLREESGEDAVGVHGDPVNSDVLEDMELFFFWLTKTGRGAWANKPAESHPAQNSASDVNMKGLSHQGCGVQSEVAQVEPKPNGKEAGEDDAMSKSKSLDSLTEPAPELDQDQKELLEVAEAMYHKPDDQKKLDGDADGTGIPVPPVREDDQEAAPKCKIPAETAETEPDHDPVDAPKVTQTDSSVSGAEQPKHAPVGLAYAKDWDEAQEASPSDSYLQSAQAYGSQGWLMIKLLPEPSPEDFDSHPVHVAAYLAKWNFNCRTFPVAEQIEKESGNPFNTDFVICYCKR